MSCPLQSSTHTAVVGFMTVMRSSAAISGRLTGGVSMALGRVTTCTCVGIGWLVLVINVLSWYYELEQAGHLLPKQPSAGIATIQ